MMLAAKILAAVVVELVGWFVPRTFVADITLIDTQLTPPFFLHNFSYRYGNRPTKRTSHFLFGVVW